MLLYFNSEREFDTAANLAITYSFASGVVSMPKPLKTYKNFFFVTYPEGQIVFNADKILLSYIPMVSLYFSFVSEEQSSYPPNKDLIIDFTIYLFCSLLTSQ